MDKTELLIKKFSSHFSKKNRKKIIEPPLKEKNER